MENPLELIVSQSMDVWQKLASFHCSIHIMVLLLLDLMNILAEG